MNKKIYIILFTLTIGGAERHASSIANFLAEKGFDVKILLLQDNKVEYTLSDNVEVVSISDFSDTTKGTDLNVFSKAALKIKKRFFKQQYAKTDFLLYIKKQYSDKLISYFNNQPDIDHSTVISFMTIPNICAAIGKKRLNYKLILAEFNSPHLEFAPDSPENYYKKKFFQFADGFVFQTEEQKEFYTFLPNVKKQVIPNPIEEISIAPYTGERKKEIVNFCRLSVAKNLPLLIESFSMLSKDFPEYSLVIYGDGPLKKETESYIEHFSLQKKAFIKPFCKNVLELVRTSAMFVSSSDREGISNSMLEAMAIGLPCVCTDCPAGGARMFITPYKNGLIVPVKDKNAMYEAMKYMIQHPDEANAMGKNATAVKNILEKNQILNRWVEFISTI